MQSDPAVPVSVLLFDVPRMMWVPAGQHEGSSPSETVTVCVATVVLPALSRAVQRTRVVPIGKAAGASLVMVTPQGSTAVAWPGFRPEHADVVIDGGTKVNWG